MLIVKYLSMNAFHSFTNISGLDNERDRPAEHIHGNDERTNEKLHLSYSKADVRFPRI